MRHTRVGVSSCGSSSSCCVLNTSYDLVAGTSPCESLHSFINHFVEATTMNIDMHEVRRGLAASLIWPVECRQIQKHCLHYNSMALGPHLIQTFACSARSLPARGLSRFRGGSGKRGRPSYKLELAGQVATQSIGHPDLKRRR